MNRYSYSPYEHLTAGLGKRINHEMHNLGWDQKTLAEKSQQSQATISNIISGKTSVSMKTIFTVMQTLNMDPLSELEYCAKRADSTESAWSNSSPNLLNTTSQNLIYDPTHLAFRGQTGHYYTYFLSTNRHDSKYIRGDLTLYDEHQICKARLHIDTAATHSELEEDPKIYTGYAFISLPQQVVYIILANESIGEISFLTYPYQQILTKGRKIECTMAMALTVSSGIDSRLPTAHRMFLSRKLLDADSEKLISAQLRMNKSLIRISEEQYKKMNIQEEINPEFLDYFLQHMSKKPYYEIDEDVFNQFIRNNPERYHDLCTLREYSTAPKNMKISESTISNIYHWIIEK